MNSDLVMDSAEAFATRLLDSSGTSISRVDFAYQQAFGRDATEPERRRAISFIDGFTSRSLTGSTSIEPTAEQRAWALFCQSLFASNEFIYVR